MAIKRRVIDSPAERPSRRGRPKLNDLFLVFVAADYVVALAAHRPPVESVAAQNDAPRERAAGWVNLARQRGLLVGLRGKGGRAGGHLSAKAKRMLRGRIDALLPALEV
jgi:hypothetical protein